MRDLECDHRAELETNEHHKSKIISNSGIKTKIWDSGILELICLDLTPGYLILQFVGLTLWFSGRALVLRQMKHYLSWVYLNLSWIPELSAGVYIL